MKKIKTAKEIRHSYIDFFLERGHSEVPGSPLVPKDDPTLLFTSAGMVQFKDNYLHPDKSPYSRAVSVQKCLRAGDLESVGKTLRHHTFFEMLGNFSFGDYFKDEAIAWAWEFVIDVLGLSPDRIFISVFEDDDEAFGIWNGKIGIPEEKIVRLGRKDNFWGPVGDTGICGPCSELYYDMGEGVGCGGDECAPGCDCDRYLEFWNLVFPQFWLDESGEYVPLEKPGIDTGLGLERLATIMQGVKDNFHTDLFRPIIDGVMDIIPRKVGDGTEEMMGVNMIADHLRGLTFTLAEGVYPSNEGRGYILRRILRRALTRMYRFGVEEPAMFRLVERVVEVMKDDYPDLARKKAEIEKVIRSEEDSFFKTLRSGRERFLAAAEDVRDRGKDIIDGESVFTLYDTYGLPVELTRSLAEEAGLKIDEEGFEAEMEAQRIRAKESSAFGPEEIERISMTEVTGGESSLFTGYENLEEQAVLRSYRGVDRDEIDGVDWKGVDDAAYELIFDRTPFYAESGGQASDTGTITIGGNSFVVVKVYKRNGEIVHLAEGPEGVIETNGRRGAVKEAFLAVDRESRSATAANHTATHLLHAALREVLGNHVTQSGSHVSSERLRFDFNHFEAISREERLKIEDMVNEWVRDSREVNTEIMTYREAVESGATALFDEKYGEKVRVIRIEGVSSELCGGTHIDSTGAVGLFMITAESSVAAGIRRIEAVTGRGALDYIRRFLSGIEDISGILKVSKEEMPAKVRSLLDEVDSLKKKIKKLQQGGVGERINEIIDSAESVEGVTIARGRIEVDSINALRHQADIFRGKVTSGVAVLSMPSEDKLHFIVTITDDLVEGGLDANKIVKELKEIAGGGGGGKRHLAQLGTKDKGKEDEVFRAITPIIKDLI